MEIDARFFNMCNHTENPLDLALEIAIKAHSGQKDKAGKPYILHPLRVMLRMETEDEMVIAVLHDVIEDTMTTLKELRARGFSDDILMVVDLLTHKEGETYESYLTRIKTNAIARKVKIADIEDNMDVRRLANISIRDKNRLQKYRQAWEALKK